MLSTPRVLLHALKLDEGPHHHLAGNFFHVLHLAKALAETGAVELMVLADEHSFERLRNSGIAAEVIMVPLNGGRVRAADRAVCQKVSELRPDLYHRPTGQLPFARLPCRTIAGIADLNFKVLPTPLLKQLYKEASYRWTLRVADCVVCVSEYVRNEAIRRLNASATKLKVVSHGTNELPAADRRLANKISVPYWLTFGHQSHKNVESCLKVLTLMKAGREEALVVVGQSSHIDDVIRPLATRLGLVGRVHFVGNVDSPTLRGLYESALGLLFLSRYEGFGLPLLEAMSCCCPVISSDVCSLPEVAGDAAILVHPMDKDAIVCGMNQLRNDEALRGRLIERGRIRAAYYSWARAAKETVQIYRNVLADGAGQRGVTQL